LKEVLRIPSLMSKFGKRQKSLAINCKFTYRPFFG
jgi:hypothetical protein